MTWKNIAVFVDATPEGEKRVGYAATLAQQSSAHLAGIHVVSAGRPGHRTDYLLCGWREGNPSFGRVAKSRRRSCDHHGSPPLRGNFREARTQCRIPGDRSRRANEDLILSSLHSDLVVIGRRELHELPGCWSPERLLLASGAPILVVPSDWKCEPISKEIVVGWNASREARRAIADALPLLLAAPSVTVLVVDSHERADRHGEEPGADIALYLARHGAHVEVEQVSSRGSPVADVIPSYAAEHGVDLIVIGAYSHARSVEMLFGGVTWTLLKRAPIPVLMSR